MPIIIDNFYVNTAKPIDFRMVASGSTARNAISYKYEGLRVWDTHDNIPYVWVNNAWQSENTNGMVGSGTANYLSKFSSSNVITNSLLFDNGTNVGIGKSNPLYKLDVNGDIKGNNIYGNGINLTNLNASNITSGKLNLNYIQNGADGQVLTNVAGSVVWANPQSNSNILLDNASTTPHYLTFVADAGQQSFKINKTLLAYKPSTNQLVLGNGTSISPSLTFTDDGMGIYRSGSNMIFSYGIGTSKMDISLSGVRTNFGSLSSTYDGKFKLTNSDSYVSIYKQINSPTTFESLNLFSNSLNYITISSNKNTITNTYTVNKIEAVTSLITITSNNIKISNNTVGEIISLFGNSTNKKSYIGFYKNDNITLSAQLGFDSTSDDNFLIRNKVNNSYIALKPTSGISLSLSGTDEELTLSRSGINTVMALSGGSPGGNTLTFKTNNSGIEIHPSTNRITFWNSVGNIYSTLAFGIAELDGIRYRGSTSNAIGIDSNNSINFNGSRPFKKIIIGKVNVRHDGAHTIADGGSYISVISGGTSGIVPTVALRFSQDMGNYQLYTSINSNNLYGFQVVSMRINNTDFVVTVSYRFGDLDWSGSLEVNILAISY